MLAMKNDRKSLIEVGGLLFIAVGSPLGKVVERRRDFQWSVSQCYDILNKRSMDRDIYI